jgi:hypothetical protein
MASRQAAIAALAARGAGNPEHLAAYIASRTRGSGSVELASTRYPVTSPNDVLIGRSATGGASVRHRRGGATIGEIRNEDGWRAVYGGKVSQRPHTHQRGALAELLGLWNKGTATLQHEGESQSTPLQPPPEQTPLMAQYEIPAIRALATPARTASDGPRVTMANGSDNDADDDSSSGNGLTPKGKSIFAKLKAKGWDDAKAMSFAKRAQSFGGAKS